MGEIVWTERARQDLQEIAEYIARDSKAYAQSFALRLRQGVQRLRDFPESGPIIPEDPQGAVRQVVVGNYRVMYRLTDKGVVILTVVHGARIVEPPRE